MKKQIYSSAIILLLSVGVSSVNAQAVIDLETGLVSTGYNNVRIRGDKGTYFSLKDDLISKSEFFYRIRVNYTIKSRHTISALFAPLETTYKGSVAKNINFEGIVFPANTDLVGTYKFNSYRLTYRYDIVHNPKVEFGLGLTAKIRDARIALSSPGLVSEKSNVGFVPLINFRLLWNIEDRLGLLLEGDALVAPQGRAEDVQLAFTYKLCDNFRVRAGYRVLEGGSDSDEVYNFTLLHYTAVGLTYTFTNK
jgi:hypothetical protein